MKKQPMQSQARLLHAVVFYFHREYNDGNYGGGYSIWGRRMDMSYAVVYSSRTGNTERLAEQVRYILGEEKCTYFGGVPEEVPEAEVIFAGFWTDKGICSEEMAEFLEKLENRTVFLFGTAGFGGAKEYFAQIINRVSVFLSDSCTIQGYFMCQGSMPDSVRQRYEAMQKQNPGDPKFKAMLDNFDKALGHPDDADLQALEGEIYRVWTA